ncbi:MAG: R3H domain-containing nucleic acid-binding protein [Propionibacteriaceae bacterium]|nr:R3H domain-containing nucleic acid-binding protein [Propionibacteriaceae bacterium]
MSQDEQVITEVEADAPVAEQADTDAADAAETEAPEADADGGGQTDAPADDAPRVSKREEALNNEGEIAADYLEELLDIADLDGDIDTFNEGGRAHVSILTDAEVLVGKDGQVLDALQELARLAVMTETGHRSRLMLDVAGFRDKQRASLQDLAADAIAEVKESGESVRLSPMNPYQRKIVHDAVAAAGLVSESEGEEPRRRVVVLPQG